MTLIGNVFIFYASYSFLQVQSWLKNDTLRFLIICFKTNLVLRITDKQITTQFWAVGRKLCTYIHDSG